MPFLAMLLMAACGDNPANEDSDPDLTWRPCRTLCEDPADAYGQLTAGSVGATDRSASGWSTGGYNTDAAASGTAAPEDDRCETCTGWYFSDCRESAGIAAACDFVYRPGPAQATGSTRPRWRSESGMSRKVCPRMSPRRSGARPQTGRSAQRRFLPFFFLPRWALLFLLDAARNPGRSATSDGRLSWLRMPVGV